MKIKNIKYKQLGLLLKIMNYRGRGSSFIFDKKDNTIQQSIRQISIVLKVTRDRISTLFMNLRKKGLMKRVIDIKDVARDMIAPHLLWYRPNIERRFHNAMFNLGSHEKAVKHRQDCFKVGMYFDPVTGEILDDVLLPALTHYRKQTFKNIYL